VGPRTCLYDVKNLKFLTLQGLELRPLGISVHSQSLYRMRYRGESVGFLNDIQMSAL
jgi:hypothetical protein